MASTLQMIDPLLSEHLVDQGLDASSARHHLDHAGLANQELAREVPAWVRRARLRLEEIPGRLCLVTHDIAFGHDMDIGKFVTQALLSHECLDFSIGFELLPTKLAAREQQKVQPGFLSELLELSVATGCRTSARRHIGGVHDLALQLGEGEVSAVCVHGRREVVEACRHGERRAVSQ